MALSQSSLRDKVPQVSRAGNQQAACAFRSKQTFAQSGAVLLLCFLLTAGSDLSPVVVGNKGLAATAAVALAVVAAALAAVALAAGAAPAAAPAPPAAAVGGLAVDVAVALAAAVGLTAAVALAPGAAVAAGTGDGEGKGEGLGEGEGEGEGEGGLETAIGIGFGPDSVTAGATGSPAGAAQAGKRIAGGGVSRLLCGCAAVRPSASATRCCCWVQVVVGG